MGNISQITLPDSHTYDIRDAKKSGVYTVIGTQTAATAAWTGVLHGVSALYTGLTINYYLPYAGVSSTSVTLNLTLDSGSTTGAVNCYLHTSRLTTHYGAGRTIMMTYYAAGDISISGKATTDNRWICDAFYDADTKVRQSLNTANTNRPLLMSYADISNTTTNVDNVSYRNKSIYANPSTGTIFAPSFTGNDESGNKILALESTAVGPSGGTTGIVSIYQNGNNNKIALLYSDSEGGRLKIRNTSGTNLVDIYAGGSNYGYMTIIGPNGNIVSNGGTGRLTTPSLKVGDFVYGVTSLYSGSLGSGSITFNYGNYKAYIIVADISSGGSWYTMIHPKNQILTTGIKYCFANEEDYICYLLKYSETTVTLSLSSKSSSGAIRQVWGIN